MCFLKSKSCFILTKWIQHRFFCWLSVLYVRILRPGRCCSCLGKFVEKGVENARGSKSGAEKVNVGRRNLCPCPFLRKEEIRGQKALVLSCRSVETEDLFLDLSTKMDGQEFRGTLKPGDDLAGRPERQWAEECQIPALLEPQELGCPWIQLPKWWAIVPC